MTKYFWQFVIFLLILFTTLAVSDGNKTTDRHYDVIISANCTIEFKHSDVKLYRKVTTRNRNKLVNVYFRFTHVVTLRQEKHGNLFEPLTWVRISGQQGKALLNLFHHYEALSLQTMSIGVEHITIGVTESRIGCLTDQPMSVLGKFFRDRLLDNFKQYMKTDIPLPAKEISEESLKGFSKEQVCYLAIGRDGDVAKFTYTCCNNNKHETFCSEITTDKWMELVKIFTSALNVLVFVFCPLLVPASYYGDVRSDVYYQKKISPKRKRIKMLKTDNADNVASRSNVMSERFVNKRMPTLSKTVHNMELNEPYEFDLGTITFRVNCIDLVSDNDVPVGIFSAIYNDLLRCEDRQHGSMMECCNEDVSGKRIPFSCSVKWFECLYPLRTTVIVFLLAIPWIARVIFYGLYEKDHFEKLKIAAESRDLRLPYLVNVTVYLSPSHVIFLICYFTIIVVGLCFGSLQKTVLHDIRSTLREYFKMQATIRTQFVGHSFKLLLEPCYKFGIFGLILFPLFWALVIPLLLISLFFYFVPILHLTLRLLGSPIKHLIPNCKQKCRQGNFWFLFFENLGRLVMTLVYLLEFYSFLFLLAELVQFVVIIAIYTLMGITLNSSYAMKYVPLLFMIAVYGHTTFGGVYRKYLVFNKILHKHLLKLLNNKSSNGQSELLSAKINTAFEIHTEDTNGSMDTFSVKNYIFSWRTKPLLFVDEKGTLYIKKMFFFQCCEMDHYAAPGTLISNFSKAICRFLLIITFLLFVGLVVMAFSEELKVSATNQTFIAMAGGLIPFVLTNFLFREVGLPMVEENDVRFKRCLNKAISQYVEKFWVVDFECEPLIKKDTQLKTASMTDDPCLQQYDLVINVQKSPRQGPNDSQDRVRSGHDLLHRAESGKIGIGSEQDQTIV